MRRSERASRIRSRGNHRHPRLPRHRCYRLAAAAARPASLWRRATAASFRSSPQSRGRYRAGVWLLARATATAQLRRSVRQRLRSAQSAALRRYNFRRGRGRQALGRWSCCSSNITTAASSTSKSTARWCRRLMRLPRHRFSIGGGQSRSRLKRRRSPS